MLLYIYHHYNVADMTALDNFLTRHPYTKGLGYTAVLDGRPAYHPEELKRVRKRWIEHGWIDQAGNVTPDGEAVAADETISAIIELL